MGMREIGEACLWETVEGVLVIRVLVCCCSKITKLPVHPTLGIKSWTAPPPVGRLGPLDTLHHLISHPILHLPSPNVFLFSLQATIRPCPSVLHLPSSILPIIEICSGIRLDTHPSGGQVSRFRGTIPNFHCKGSYRAEAKKIPNQTLQLLAAHNWAFVCEWIDQVRNPFALIG